MARRSRFVSPSRSARGSSRRSPLRRIRVPLIVLLLITTFLIYLYHGHSSASSTPSTADLFPYLTHKSIDWSSFAYSSYATSTAYLCNSLLIFDALHRYGSKADRVLFYPDFWDTQISGASDRESQLLVMARDIYKVKLMPVDMDAGGLDEDSEDEDGDGGEGVGNTSPGGGLGSDVIRFLAWDQRQYDRVIHLESDITLQRHLDELFLLPRAPIAMTRAYHPSHASASSSSSNNPSTKAYKLHLSPSLILLEPSRETYNLLTATADPNLEPPIASDSALYTSIFAATALILPHSTYNFPISELRTSDHSAFFGVLSAPSSSPVPTPEWHVDQSLSAAALVQFSDAPFPKPWIMWPREMLAEEMPICEGDDGRRREACANKEKWFAFYDDFRRRRKDVCRLLTETAPRWEGGEAMTRMKGKEKDKGNDNGTDGRV